MLKKVVDLWMQKQILMFVYLRTGLQNWQEYYQCCTPKYSIAQLHLVNDARGDLELCWC